MQLGELIRRFRTQANDKVEPYFNEDEDVKDWLNDAVNEACIRGRLVHESQNNDVCKITVLIGSSRYQLHDSLYELTRIWFKPSDGAKGQCLSLMSAELLDHYYDGENWRVKQGNPEHIIQDDTGVRLVPIPIMDGELQLEGYRTPIAVMVEDTDTPVDLHKAHHPYLIEWALHKAFSVPDTEFFDPNRAQIAEAKFTEYFGDRPDSDLRRITREDVPHTVVPFMP